MVTLETERLVMRPPRESDLDDYARMTADGETMRYMGGTLDREQTWRQIAMMLGHWQIRGYGLWALEEKSGGRFLGRVGFINPEGWPGFEIGWLVGREYQGRGFATEAARAALDWGFANVDEDHVISLIMPDNLASIAVARKLGEAPEGETRIREFDVVIYGMDREEYLAGR